MIEFVKKLLNGQPVEWKMLGEIGEFVRGTGLQKSDFTETGVPAIHYGQIYTKYGNSTSETISFVSEELAKKLRKASKNDLIIAGVSENVEDVCKCVVWKGNEEVCVSGDTFIFKHNQNADYIGHLLRTNDFLNYKKKYAVGAKVTRLQAGKLPVYKIPLPPLSVQRKIADILDKFTELKDNLNMELNKELGLRKKQYAYYREKLLTFDQNTPRKTLGEVCQVQRGRRLTKRDLVENGEFAVFHGGVEPIGFYNQNNREANSTMIINVGASAGTVGYSNEKFWSSDGCFCFSHTDVLSQRFLFYFLQNIENSIKSKVRKAGIPTLDNRFVETLKIPLPPLEEQKRIVGILDQFDKLINDISEGIPAEIHAREKQFQYYREKLLSF